MTPTLLVILLLAQAQAADNRPAGALEPPEVASPVETWCYLARVEASGQALLPALGTGGTLLFPEGMGRLRPGAFASMGLGVDNTR